MFSYMQTIVETMRVKDVIRQLVERLGIMEKEGVSLSKLEASSANEGSAHRKL